MQYRRKKGIKVITIHGKTYNRLRDLSRIPDSFDSVISRLLDYYELSNNNNNNNKIKDTAFGVPAPKAVEPQVGSVAVPSTPNCYYCYSSQFFSHLQKFASISRLLISLSNSSIQASDFTLSPIFIALR